MKFIEIFFIIMILVICNIILISNSNETFIYGYNITNNINVNFTLINSSGIYTFILKPLNLTFKEGYINVSTGLTFINLSTNLPIITVSITYFKNLTLNVWCGLLLNGGEIMLKVPVLSNTTINVGLLSLSEPIIISLPSVSPYSFTSEIVKVWLYPMVIINYTYKNYSIKNYKINLNNSNINFYVDKIGKISYLLEIDYYSNFINITSYGIDSKLIYNFQYYNLKNLSIYSLNLGNGKLGINYKILYIYKYPVILTNSGLEYLPYIKVKNINNGYIINYSSYLYYLSSNGQLYSFNINPSPQYVTLLLRNFTILSAEVYNITQPSILILPSNNFIELIPSTYYYKSGDRIYLFLINNTYILINKINIFEFIKIPQLNSIIFSIIIILIPIVFAQLYKKKIIR